MSSTSTAFINPRMLVWARDRSGVKLTNILKTLNVPEKQFLEWEQGNNLPSFSKALQIAKVLKIPFGYLYLNSPPADEIPIPDLRTKSDQRPAKPSPELIEVVQSVLYKQEWYREFMQEEGAKRLPYVGKFSITEPTKNIANDIRLTLGLANGIRHKSNTWSDYLRNLTHKAEDLGIVVLRSGVVGNNSQRKLSVSEFQGFALSDPIAPFVFVNSKDFETAKIFTLIHELAHIWLNTSGISNANEAIPSVKAPVIERVCNSVAAQALVEPGELSELWKQTSGNLDQLARHFLVSTLVILRRANELGLITRETFFVRLQEEREKVRPKKKAGGGSFYRNLEARQSGNFSDAVISDVRRGGTVLRDAAQLLDLKVPTLLKVVERSK
jgi:Zn-dependent peptidase ImmA (M78 family)